MDPSIDSRIAMIEVASHTLLTPVTKEVVTDVARGSVQINRTPRHVSHTGRDGSTPEKTGIAVGSKLAPALVLIVITNISPACGISGTLQVGKKQQSTSPDKVRNEQKLDTAADGKIPNEYDSASFFSKVIGHELSHGSSNKLYLCCWMKLSSNVVQIKALQFVNLGIPAVST